MTDPWIKSAVDRIENLEEEKRAIGSDVRDVYDEVKEKGYNTKALRKIIAERRQKDAKEIADAMDGYRVALGMAVAAIDAGMSLDAASEEYGFSRSAIHRASHSERNALSGMDRPMMADDFGEWLPRHDSETGELPREMVADDLGDPLLITNPFRARVKAIAPSVTMRQKIEAFDPRPEGIPEDDLVIPAFLRRTG